VPPRCARSSVAGATCRPSEASFPDTPKPRYVRGLRLSLPSVPALHSPSSGSTCCRDRSVILLLMDQCSHRTDGPHQAAGAPPQSRRRGDRQNSGQIASSADGAESGPNDDYCTSKILIRHLFSSEQGNGINTQLLRTMGSVQDKKCLYTSLLKGCCAISRHALFDSCAQVV
jgi:hypothetical protein